jgi:hypothetical protein
MKKAPHNSLVVIFTILIFLLPVLVMAQCDTTGVGGDPQAPGCPGTSDAPFDGGISVLVATAVGYGITKMKKKKENKEVI